MCTEKNILKLYLTVYLTQIIVYFLIVQSQQLNLSDIFTKAKNRGI